MNNLVDRVMAYEAGEMSNQEILQLFADLVKSGVVWNLQGSYGRAATALIEGGYINTEGNVLQNMEH